MNATDREFQAQSGFIAACDDPDTLFDWMREYRESERAAIGRGDEDEANQMDDLAELAEDRIVELKAAQIIAARPKPQVAETQRVAAIMPPVVDDSAAELRKVREELAASRDAQANAERERARAERERVAAVERAEQREREADAAKVAADKAAEAKAHAVNATPIAPHNWSPEREAIRERVRENERLRLAAARAPAAQQPVVPAPPIVAPPKPAPVRWAAPAPTSPRTGAAIPTTARPSTVPQPLVRPAPRPQAAMPTQTAAPVAELTPLARLFQQRLTETTPALPAARPQPPRPHETRRTAWPATPPPAPPPPADPVDALPPLTGADLTSYRTWLGASQRALATKFSVEQSVISKSEGKPTTILPPQLRKALHEAMGEPRPDVGGAK